MTFCLFLYRVWLGTHGIFLWRMANSETNYRKFVVLKYAHYLYLYFKRAWWLLGIISCLYSINWTLVNIYAMPDIADTVIHLAVTQLTLEVVIWNNEMFFLFYIQGMLPRFIVYLFFAILKHVNSLFFVEPFIRGILDIHTFHCIWVVWISTTNNYAPGWENVSSLFGLLKLRFSVKWSRGHLISAGLVQCWCVIESMLLLLLC